MDSVDRPERLRVSVAYSPGAGVVDHTDLSVPPGSTVAEALQLSGLPQRHPALDLTTAPLGVWGASCTAKQVLRDGDRVEVYRALRVDPKEARRERYRKDRGSSAGRKPASLRR